MRTVYVLTSRCGTSLGTPEVSSSYEEVYKQMKSEYEEWLEDCLTNDYGCEKYWAWVDTGNNYVEWEITECEVKD